MSRNKKVIFTLTSTPEKQADFEAIINERNFSDEIVFVSVHKLVDAFHNAPEDTKSRVNNAKQKLEEAKGFMDACKIPDSPERKKLEALCEELGINCNPENIYFAADDASLETKDPDIWDHLRVELAPLVPESILDAIHSNGPSVEAGPVMNAVGGAENLARLFHKAAASANYPEGKPIEITKYVTLYLKSLTGKEHTITGEEPVTLKREIAPTSNLYFSLDDVFCPIGQDKTIAELGMEHKASGSFRAKVVDGLLAIPTDKTMPEQEFIADTYKNANYVIGLPNANPENQIVKGIIAKRNNIEFLRDRLHGDTGKGPNPETAYDYLALPRQVVENSDAIVFTPFNPKTISKSEYSTLLHSLFSRIVQEQLEADIMGRPVILMNHNGCYDGILGVVERLIENCMMKGYDRKSYEKPLVLSNPEVEHLASSYFDSLKSDNLEALHGATLEVIEQRLDGKKPVAQLPSTPKPETEKHGTKAPSDIFVVGVFCSAGSKNKILNDNLEKYGEFLARNEIGAAWGGGDRDAMGSFYKGYMAIKTAHPEKNTHISGYSTKPILIAETQKGRMPKVDYAEINKDIGERKAGIISDSNMLVVAPGGAGTVEEWCATLLLRQAMPEQFSDKKLVLYAPDLYGKEEPFWAKEARVILGDEFMNNVQENPDFYADQGILFVTDLKELEHITLQQRDVFEKTSHVAAIRQKANGGGERRL